MAAWASLTRRAPCSLRAIAEPVAVAQLVKAHRVVEVGRPPSPRESERRVCEALRAIFVPLDELNHRLHVARLGLLRVASTTSSCLILRRHASHLSPVHAPVRTIRSIMFFTCSAGMSLTSSLVGERARLLLGQPLRDRAALAHPPVLRFTGSTGSACVIGHRNSSAPSSTSLRNFLARSVSARRPPPACRAACSAATDVGGSRRHKSQNCGREIFRRKMEGAAPTLAPSTTAAAPSRLSATTTTARRSPPRSRRAPSSPTLRTAGRPPTNQRFSAHTNTSVSTVGNCTLGARTLAAHAARLRRPRRGTTAR